jgi:hypothetical protein
MAAVLGRTMVSGVAASVGACTGAQTNQLAMEFHAAPIK